MTNKVKVTVRAASDVDVTVRVRAEQETGPLRFGTGGNAKLDQGVWTFSLPAGHSCPQARECRARADRRDGTITDGREVRFRCYAASMEARHPSVRRSRWYNFMRLMQCRSRQEMADLILASLSPFCRLLRVHDSGDYFSATYFGAWLDVARERHQTVVYWYTKSLSYWAAHLDEIGDGHSPGKLSNVVPTASWGGREDELIERYGLRSARVVFSVGEAEERGLSLDHDDSHAMTHGEDFALLIHGTQPANTEAAAATRDLRNAGFAGYGKATRIALY